MGVLCVTEKVAKSPQHPPNAPESVLLRLRAHQRHPQIIPNTLRGRGKVQKTPHSIPCVAALATCWFIFPLLLVHLRKPLYFRCRLGVC